MSTETITIEELVARADVISIAKTGGRVTADTPVYDVEGNESTLAVRAATLPGITKKDVDAFFKKRATR